MARQRLAVVVIGRNEGERLLRCLRSCVGADTVVYVDSGSTDGSMEHARALGVHVVALDMDQPFTAARARNAGRRELRSLAAPADFVQFVDGDCELQPGWLEAAASFLDTHPDVGVVSGRLRERHPEASIYNRLCDVEWDTPLGDARHCGGIAMFRASAFDEVSGFRETLIAGEEPELCVRLRAAGWRVWRMAGEMAWHDAAMRRFRQWWRRSVRSGYAFAEGAYLHGRSAERHWVRESIRAWVWAGAVPLLVVAGVAAGYSAAAWLLTIYPVQLLRRALRVPGPSWGDRLAQASFELMSRFAELRGQLLFISDVARRSRRGLLEYK